MSRFSLVGQTVGDRFRVISELAEGGFGSVYLAEQIALDRQVVIKFLHLELLGDQDLVARFHREAHVIAGINHKNVVQCYAFGMWQERYPYLVFEYLQGQSLRQKINNGPMEWQDAFAMGADVCAGLSQAHQRGITHRDIKPENLFITDDGVVKILDFGLAHDESQKLTQTGALIGSAMYMSPEQGSGKVTSPRSDLYSLGCVLYECIAGRPPLYADTPMGVAYLHAHEYPPLLSKENKVPACVDNVLFHAMQKEPADRIADADAMARDLLAATKMDATDQAVPSPMLSAAKIERKHIPRLKKVHFLCLSTLAVISLALVSLETHPVQVVSFMGQFVGTDKTTFTAGFADRLYDAKRYVSAAKLYQSVLTQLPSRTKAERFTKIRTLSRLIYCQTKNDSEVPLAVTEQICRTLNDAFRYDSPETWDSSQFLIISEAILQLERSSWVEKLPTWRREELGYIYSALVGLCVIQHRVDVLEKILPSYKALVPTVMRAKELCQYVQSLETENDYKSVVSVLKAERLAFNGFDQQQRKILKALETALDEAERRFAANKSTWTKESVVLPILSVLVFDIQEEGRSGQHPLAALQSSMISNRGEPNFLAFVSLFSEYFQRSGNKNSGMAKSRDMLFWEDMTHACYLYDKKNYRAAGQICLAIMDNTEFGALYRDAEYLLWRCILMAPSIMPPGRVHTDALLAAQIQLARRKEFPPYFLKDYLVVALWNEPKLEDRIGAAHSLMREVKPYPVGGGEARQFALLCLTIEECHQHSLAVQMGRDLMTYAETGGSQDTDLYYLEGVLAGLYKADGNAAYSSMQDRCAKGAAKLRDWTWRTDFCFNHRALPSGDDKICGRFLGADDLTPAFDNYRRKQWELATEQALTVLAHTKSEYEYKSAEYFLLCALGHGNVSSIPDLLNRWERAVAIIERRSEMSNISLADWYNAQLAFNTSCEKRIAAARKLLNWSGRIRMVPFFQLDEFCLFVNNECKDRKLAIDLGRRLLKRANAAVPNDTSQYRLEGVLAYLLKQEGDPSYIDFQKRSAVHAALNGDKTWYKSLGYDVVTEQPGGKAPVTKRIAVNLGL